MLNTTRELRDRLSVAVASIEAFVDGILAPTPQRLCVVLAALRDVSASLDTIDAAAAGATLSIVERRLRADDDVAALR